MESSASIQLAENFLRKSYQDMVEAFPCLHKILLLFQNTRFCQNTVKNIKHSTSLSARYGLWSQLFDLTTFIVAYFSGSAFWIIINLHEKAQFCSLVLFATSYWCKG